MEIRAKIEELMNTIPLEEYWPGFRPVAYAVYNFEEVFLFNHPSTDYKTSTIPWEPALNGADTLILFRGLPTAIVNLNCHPAIESLYPVLVTSYFTAINTYMVKRDFLTNYWAASIPCS
jgi:hypothetical protein